MRVRAVLTDLDGTLLEADGTLSLAARGAVDALRARGIPLALLTSKTRLELQEWLRELDTSLGCFENGAGILTPSGVEIAPEAVPVATLRRLCSALSSGAPDEPLVPFDALSDDQLIEVTGLERGRLAAARAREYDLPFLAPGRSGHDLARELAALEPAVTLVAGGRFWHLMGRHGKRDAAARLLARIGGGGEVIGLGDAANDDFLDLVDVPVVIPRTEGPDAELLRRVPRARVARWPAGAGWAEVVGELLAVAEKQPGV